MTTAGSPGPETPNVVGSLRKRVFLRVFVRAPSRGAPIPPEINPNMWKTVQRVEFPQLAPL